MSSSFSVSGLISGLDWSSLVDQLMQIESQPIVRLQQRISTLEAQQTALTDLRTQLLSLRGAVQDFQFGTVFGQFESASSDAEVLTAEVSGENPVVGSYSIEVLQLASATVATSSGSLGGAIDPDATLENSGMAEDISEGTFTINGVEFTVDPTTDSLNDILADITASDAGVNATYDAASDSVILTNKTDDDTSVINFGGTDDDSNFLSVVKLTGATQFTNATGETEVQSTRNLGAIDANASLDTVNFANSGIAGGLSGSFRINGVTITIDAAEDSLADVLEKINNSDAGVTASYDSSSDTIRIVSETLGSRTIGFTAGTSNFLEMTNLSTAVQDAGSDSQFTVNGGAVETRNTNEVTDAVGGVTLSLLSTGDSTVTISSDDDGIVEDVQEFLDDFNASISNIHDLISSSGTMSGDSTLRMVDDFLRTTIFNQVDGISGTFSSLAEIGITTGDDFDPEATTVFTLDEDVFREALLEDRTNVENLFSNDGETGVADELFDYLDEVTGLSGFIYERSKSNGIIDDQIDSLNDQIERVEDRVEQKRARLEAKFIQMEQLQSSYQTMYSSLSSVSSSL